METGKRTQVLRQEWRGFHISKSKDLQFEHAPNIVNGLNKMICLTVCISPLIYL